MDEVELLSADLTHTLSLPFANGGIKAGFPSPAQDYLTESIDLTKTLIRHSETTFYARVSGDSMNPGLVNDQKILINRFVYKLSQPAKGDVIMFLPNGNTNTHYYVRRVVAVPGDKVYIEGGVLYVNGTPSDIVTGKIPDPGLASNELTLEQGMYFVLSDDLSDSDDSRSANIGPVESKYILGKVWLAFPEGDSKMHMVD